MISYYLDQSWHLSTFQQFLDYFHLSKANQNTMINQQAASTSNRLLKLDSLLYEGDEVMIDDAIFQKESFLPTFHPLDVLFENQDLLIINKPKGLIIYPDQPNQANTLVNDVLGYYQQHHIPGPVRYLHRLDQDTTGCFVIAKHLLSQSFYTAIWDHTTIKRTYLAKVAGSIKAKQQTIVAPIGRNRHQSNQYRVSETGKYAATEVTLLQTKHHQSLVLCHLLTGRTHQIRVHLAHIGHPIIGDPIYGTANEHGLSLHSYEVEIPLLLNQPTLKVTAPIPTHLKL